jgi:hypothetical protein
VSDQLYIPAALPRGKGPRYRLNRTLDEQLGQSECFGDETHLLPLPETERHFVGTVSNTPPELRTFRANN